MNVDPSPLMQSPTDQTALPVAWSCPECSGTIWESRQGALLQFRCRVGHAYSTESFLEEHSDTIERTLWAALRLIEERVDLADHLGKDAATHQEDEAKIRFNEDAARHRSKADELRRILGL
jgi:two-component system chemotaxis response regulator CheB